MPVLTLAAVPWTAVRDRPGEGPVVAVLPLGVLEAHGPHLPLATDVIIAEAMADGAAFQLDAAGWTVLRLPAMPYAAAPFAEAFPGTVSISADIVTRLILDVAAAMVRHGVGCLAIANAHLDPAHRTALADALSETDLRLAIPDIARRRHAARLGEEFASGACHAGRFETSIVLAARPDLVRDDVRAGLAANPASLSDAIVAGKSTFAEAGGPDAYFGWPADASAEEGEHLIMTLGEILTEAVLEATR